MVSDRSFVSSLAIQGCAQGLGIESVLSLNTEALAGCIPDLILFLDTDLDVARSRTFDATGDKWEKMEKSFFEKVIDGYREAKQLPLLLSRWREVDAR